MRRVTARGLLILALSFATGGLPALAAQPPAEEVRVKEPVAPPPAEVRLLDAGAEEGRAEIRYRPVAGSEQLIEMRMKLEMTTEMDGQETPGFPMPGTAFTMKIVVDKVEPNGDIHYKMTTVGLDVYDAQDAPAMMVTGMKEQLKNLLGLAGTVVISDRGVPRSGKFTGGDEMDPMMAQTIEGLNQSLSQFASPVPAEPVGIGAKWEVKASPNMNGVKIESLSTCTLLERREGVIKLRLEQVVTAPEQDVHNEQVPQAKIHLKSMRGTGKGTMTLDLAQPMSQEAEVTSDTKMEMDMAFQGQSMSMKQSIKTKMMLLPGKAAPAEAGAEKKAEETQKDKK